MNKNYWPAAIVGIIVFGMMIISVGVWIAVKHPVVDEQMFGEHNRVVDEQINTILKEQRFFENLATVRLGVNENTILLQNPYDKGFSTPNVSKLTPDFFRIDRESECVLEVLPKTKAFSDFEVLGMEARFSSLSGDSSDIITLAFDDKDIQEAKPLVYKFSPNDTLLLKSGVYKMEVHIRLSKKSSQDVSHDMINAFFETRVEIINNE